MSKRTRLSEEKKLKRYEKNPQEGFIRVHDFASHGLSSRIPLNEENEFLSTLSRNETYAAAYYLSCPWIKEIRTQYPLLPVSETDVIADQLGVKYAGFKGKEHIVMTLDLLITFYNNGREWTIARTVKEFKDLMNPRVLEKLQIEYLYWQSRKIDWGIITEKELPRAFKKNVMRIRSRVSLDGLGLSAGNVKKISKYLTDRVIKKDTPLVNITDACDETLGYEPGTALAVAYHLIVRRIWKINLYELIDPEKILNVISIKE